VLKEVAGDRARHELETLVIEKYFKLGTVEYSFAFQ
jgi:hypothetical protein